MRNYNQIVSLETFTSVICIGRYAELYGRIFYFPYIQHTEFIDSVKYGVCVFAVGTYMVVVHSNNKFLAMLKLYNVINFLVGSKTLVFFFINKGMNMRDLVGEIDT